VGSSRIDAEVVVAADVDSRPGRAINASLVAIHCSKEVAGESGTGGSDYSGIADEFLGATRHDRTNALGAPE